MFYLGERFFLSPIYLAVLINISIYYVGLPKTIILVNINRLIKL